MSKRKKNDLLKEACHAVRCSSVKKFVQQAAEWSTEKFGQRIGRGAILRALTNYRRRHRLPDWLLRYVRQVLSPQPAVHIW